MKEQDEPMTISLPLQPHEEVQFLAAAKCSWSHSEYPRSRSAEPDSRGDTATRDRRAERAYQIGSWTVGKIRACCISRGNRPVPSRDVRQLRPSDDPTLRHAPSYRSPLDHSENIEQDRGKRAE